VKVEPDAAPAEGAAEGAAEVKQLPDEQVGSALLAGACCAAVVYSCPTVHGHAVLLGAWQRNAGQRLADLAPARVVAVLLTRS
jgi:hypothetical protein